MRGGHGEIEQLGVDGHVLRSGVMERRKMKFSGVRWARASNETRQYQNHMLHRSFAFARLVGRLRKGTLAPIDRGDSRRSATAPVRVCDIRADPRSRSGSRTRAYRLDRRMRGTESDQRDFVMFDQIAHDADAFLARYHEDLVHEPVCGLRASYDEGPFEALRRRPF